LADTDLERESPVFPAKGAGLFYEHRDVRTHHFRRSYLKANKVSKSEGTKQLNVHMIFKTVLMLFTKKISKLVHACRNYSLPKFVFF